MTVVLADVIMSGTHANRPTDNAANTEGRLYFETDTLLLFRDTGSGWETYSPSVSSGGADVLQVQIFS